MDRTRCIDVFTENRADWMYQFSCQRRQSPYGSYFHFDCTPEEEKEIRRNSFLSHVRYRTYDRRWDRSDNYRQTFFRTSHGPYRCRYCGRYLNTKYLQVDHLVPVAKTRKGGAARAVLEMRGISNVNDPRNLVPSCSKCNRKKGDHMGMWLIRGIMGKYSWFPKFYRIAKLATFLIALLLAVFASRHTVWIPMPSPEKAEYSGAVIELFRIKGW